MAVVGILLVLAIGILIGVMIRGKDEPPTYIIKTIDKQSSERHYQVWEGKRKLSTWMTPKQCEKEIYADAFLQIGGKIKRE